MTRPLPAETGGEGQFDGRAPRSSDSREGLFGGAGGERDDRGGGTGKGKGRGESSDGRAATGKSADSSRREGGRIREGRGRGRERAPAVARATGPRSGPGPAIAATGLRKSFGDTAVLDGIDLTVPEGSVFSLLGPNGAGKTTAVHILSTLIPADGGDIRVAGHSVRDDPDAVRGSIGVTGQFSAVDELFTGEDNLRLMADLHHLGRSAGRRRTAELLERFGLEDAARRPVATYSGGMRRRLDLAMTLVGEPRLIFLDEPTTGLDPRSRREMWDTVRELVAGGVTVFLTTQYLDEADHLADRVAVLDQGRIVAEGTPQELKNRVHGGHIRFQFPGPQALRSAASLLGSVATVDEEALTLQVPDDGDIRSLRALLDVLDDAGAGPGRLSIHTPDLDDVFFALTGRSTAAPAPEGSHR